MFFIYDLDIKKPRLMATVIDLLETKSFNSENIKQKMLELKEKKLEFIKEKLTVKKKILQQLQNINTELSVLREHFYIYKNVKTLSKFIKVYYLL